VAITPAYKLPRFLIKVPFFLLLHSLSDSNH
jgi:hypothetical protein